MEKRIRIIAAFLLLSAGLIAAEKHIEERIVVFRTSIECKNCEKKVVENISFEKGVRDLKVNVPTKEVTITFDAAKTDTLKLGTALRKLGYRADVVSYKVKQ